jgi:hypothetical protein
MYVVIKRIYQEKGTLGNLTIFDDSDKKLGYDPLVYSCKTLELPNKNNERQISCIPEGGYDVVKIISPTKGACFLLKNVPGRTAIEIHIGNFASGKKVDTQGCILPGLRYLDMNADGTIDIVESTKAMGKLLQLLPNTFKLKIYS